MRRLLGSLFARRCSGCRSRRDLRFFSRGGALYELPLVRLFLPDVALCAACERKAIAVDGAARFGASEYPAPCVGPKRREMA